MRDAPSQTAEMVCFLRAAEQRLGDDDRVLTDPYAALFLGPLWRAALATLRATGRLGDLGIRLSAGLQTYVVARHAFMDACLRDALTAGRVDQLVLLGAGYDTRAWRFADLLGDRPVFEVDHPATGARKARMIVGNEDLPAVDRRQVAIDFQTQSLDEVLLAAGFDRTRPAFVVWEGVTMYLTRAAVKGTFSTLRSLAAPGSEIAVTFWHLLDSPDVAATAHRMSANLLHFLGEPITFGIHPEDVVHFLERLGWTTLTIADHTALERDHVRGDRRVYPANYVVHARATA